MRVLDHTWLDERNHYEEATNQLYDIPTETEVQRCWNGQGWVGLGNERNKEPELKIFKAGKLFYTILESGRYISLYICSNQHKQWMLMQTMDFRGENKIPCSWFGFNWFKIWKAMHAKWQECIGIVLVTFSSLRLSTQNPEFKGSKTSCDSQFAEDTIHS